MVDPFDKTVSMVVKALRFSILEGHFTMHPSLMQYMQELGIVTNVTEPGEQEQTKDQTTA